MREACVVTGGSGACAACPTWRRRRDGSARTHTLQAEALLRSPAMMKSCIAAAMSTGKLASPSSATPAASQHGRRARERESGAAPTVVLAHHLE